MSDLLSSCGGIASLDLNSGQWGKEPGITHITAKGNHSTPDNSHKDRAVGPMPLKLKSKDSKGLESSIPRCLSRARDLNYLVGSLNGFRRLSSVSIADKLVSET